MAAERRAPRHWTMSSLAQSAFKIKKVRFHGSVRAISIPSVGKGLPVRRAKKTRWRSDYMNESQGEDGDDFIKQRGSYAVESEGELPGADV